MRSYFIYILCLFSAASLAQEAELDTNVMLIGDFNELRIKWKVQDRLESVIINDEILETLEDIELVRNAQLRHQLLEDGHLYEKVYTFSVYDSGRYEIPSLDIEWNNNGSLARYSTPKFYFDVVYPPSLDTASSSLRPIKPIFEAPLNWFDLRWIVYGLLALIFLIAVALYARRKPKQEAVEIEIDPHEEAYIKLQVLESKNYIEQGKYESFQIELTAIMRQFLSRKYEFNALGMTTREILYELKATDFPSTKLTSLKELLNMADLVKFARAETPFDFNRRMLLEAREIIKASNEWN